MSILAGFEAFLYVISTLLFYPVIIGLVFLTFWILIYFGGFLREYVERKQGNLHALKRYERLLNSEINSQAEMPNLGQKNNYPVIDGLDLRLERLLQSEELRLIKSLDKIRFAIRVGPALGLMGTLIPMGVALSALAQGDIPKMAGSMVTAFTTTVVGLACGVAAYMMSLIKEKWIREDMREMEYLTELALRKHNASQGLKVGEDEDEVSEEAERV